MIPLSFNMVKEMRKLSVKAIILIVLMSWAIAEGASAQGEKTPRKRSFPPVILKTNLLYDMLAAPAIGVECSPATKWSVALNGAYGWTDGGPFGDRVRVVTGDAELRYWPGGKAMLQGLHAGAYCGVYRYDFLFGRKGEQAKINWGMGLSVGYAFRIDDQFGVDLNVGFGYIGGKYKSYEVSDDAYRHNVWQADKMRHYIGPAKAEVSLVWHLPLGRKGGAL